MIEAANYTHTYISTAQDPRRRPCVNISRKRLSNLTVILSILSKKVGLKAPRPLTSECLATDLQQMKSYK